MYVPADNIVFRRIGDEGVLVPTVGQLAVEGKLFAVNELGALIWGLLCKGIEPARIAQEITETYNVEQAEALADLGSFIEDLVAAGCLIAS